MTRISMIAAAMLFTPLAANASPVGIVISFDMDASGNVIASNTPITNQYALWGVLFEGIEDGAPVDVVAAPDPDGFAVPSAPNALSNCAIATFSCPSNRADIVRISFATPIESIALFLNSLGPLPVTFELYDAANVLLETQTVASPVGSYTQLVFGASGVSRIDALQPNDNWAWAIDDLSFFLPNGVPAPAGIALFGLGALALGAARRR